MAANEIAATVLLGYTGVGVPHSAMSASRMTVAMRCRRCVSAACSALRARWRKPAPQNSARTPMCQLRATNIASIRVRIARRVRPQHATAGAPDATKALANSPRPVEGGWGRGRVASDHSSASAASSTACRAPRAIAARARHACSAARPSRPRALNMGRAPRLGSEERNVRCHVISAKRPYR